MSLNIKTTGILLAVMILYTAAQGIIHRNTILPGFLALEKMEADKNISRPVQAIEREMYHLSSFAHDWSAWDDTYDFVVTQSETYIRVNLLPDDTFEMNQIHMMYICDTHGRVIWSKVVDPLSGEIIERPDIPGQQFLEREAVFDDTLDKEVLSEMERTGLIQTPLGPLIISIRPILTSSNEGPSRGVFVMGRFLTESGIQEMIKQTEVSFELQPLTDQTGADDQPGLRDVIQGKSQDYLDSSNMKNLYAYSVLNDIQKHPAYLVKMVMPRNILRKGLETLRFSMISIVASGFILILLILILLHFTILGPISDLSKHVGSVEESGDLAHRLDMDRADEIGVLARRFDGMLEKLSDMRAELLDRSYYSGLAGMTSDILHHGRNILMPMNHTLSQLTDVCHRLPRENIYHAIEELNQGTAGPDREKDLQRFLFLATQEMITAIGQSEKLLEAVSNQSQDMEQLFNDLEKFSRSGNLASDIDPGMVIRNACSQIPNPLKNSCVIRIGEGMDSMPKLKAEPVTLGYVLTSVLGHAAHLAAQRPDDQAEIHIGVRTEKRNDASQICIEVSGNGPEQDAEQIKRLFSRDYTDENTGPLCSSLHWCSNVISAMGGDLELTSQAQSTVFHLFFPMGGDA